MDTLTDNNNSLPKEDGTTFENYENNIDNYVNNDVQFEESPPIDSNVFEATKKKEYDKTTNEVEPDFKHPSGVENKKEKNEDFKFDNYLDAQTNDNFNDYFDSNIDILKETSIADNGDYQFNQYKTKTKSIITPSENAKHLDETKKNDVNDSSKTEKPKETKNVIEKDTKTTNNIENFEYVSTNEEKQKEGGDGVSLKTLQNINASDYFGYENFNQLDDKKQEQSQVNTEAENPKLFTDFDLDSYLENLKNQIPNNINNNDLTNKEPKIDSKKEEISTVDLTGLETNNLGYEITQNFEPTTVTKITPKIEDSSNIQNKDIDSYKISSPILESIPDKFTSLETPPKEYIHSDNQNLGETDYISLLKSVSEPKKDTNILKDNNQNLDTELNYQLPQNYDTGAILSDYQTTQNNEEMILPEKKIETPIIKDEPILIQTPNQISDNPIEITSFPNPIENSSFPTTVETTKQLNPMEIKQEPIPIADTGITLKTINNPLLEQNTFLEDTNNNNPNINIEELITPSIPIIPTETTNFENIELINNPIISQEKEIKLNNVNGDLFDEYQTTTNIEGIQSQYMPQIDANPIITNNYVVPQETVITPPPPPNVQTPTPIVNKSQPVIVKRPKIKKVIVPKVKRIYVPSNKKIYVRRPISSGTVNVPNKYVHNVSYPSTLTKVPTIQMVKRAQPITNTILVNPSVRQFPISNNIATVKPPLIPTPPKQAILIANPPSNHIITSQPKVATIPYSQGSITLTQPKIKNIQYNQNYRMIEPKLIKAPYNPNYFVAPKTNTVKVPYSQSPINVSKSKIAQCSQKPCSFIHPNIEKVPYNQSIRVNQPKLITVTEPKILSVPSNQRLIVAPRTKTITVPYTKD